MKKLLLQLTPTLLLCAVSLLSGYDVRELRPDLNLTPLREVIVEDFSEIPYESYFDVCEMPVVFRGAVKNCGAAQWTLASLVENHGEECYALTDDGNKDRNLPSEELIAPCPFQPFYKVKDFIEHMNHFSNVKMDLFAGEDLFAEATNYPEWLLKQGEFYGGFFFGVNGTHVEIHEHSYEDAYLAQYSGRKLVILALASVANDTCILTHSHNPKKGYGSFQTLKSSLEDYPCAREINFYWTILERGDLLYLPKNWYHDIYYLEPSIGIALFVKNRPTEGFLHHLDRGLCIPTGGSLDPLN